MVPFTYLGYTVKRVVLAFIVGLCSCIESPVASINLNTAILFYWPSFYYSLDGKNISESQAQIMKTEQLMAHLPDLAAFIVVAQEKNFTEAAKKLDVTPSALSKLVSRLEKALQAKLFVRSTRRLSITPVGEAIAQQAQLMMQSAQQAFVVAENNRESLSGSLTIAAPEAFLHSVLQPIVIQFLEQHSQLSIKLLAIDGDFDLIEQGVDVCFRLTNTPQSDLVARDLGPTELVLVAHNDYLSRKGSPSDPTELANHDCLFIAERQDTARWTFKQDTQTKQVDVLGRFAANQSRLRLDAVRNGLGVGIFHDFVVNDLISNGELTRVLPDWVLESRYFGSVYLQYVQTPFTPAKISTFVTFCEQSIKLS